MDYRSSIHETDRQAIVSIRERHAASEMPAFLGRTFEILFQQLGRQGSAPAGPPFVIYHEFGLEAIDAEACIPVAKVVAGGLLHLARTPGDDRGPDAAKRRAL